MRDGREKMEGETRWKCRKGGTSGKRINQDRIVKLFEEGTWSVVLKILMYGRKVAILQ
jgi:hypothetical protein